MGGEGASLSSMRDQKSAVMCCGLLAESSRLRKLPFHFFLNSINQMSRKVGVSIQVAIVYFGRF